MEPLLQRILNLLIAPPGNLVFHLVLAFSILASLQAIWIARQGSRFSRQSPDVGFASGRILFGLGALLLGQIGLFICSGLAWQGVLDPHIVLPPLDRAVLVYSLIWIVWMWNFPAPARLGDLVTGFLNLGVVIFFIFTLASWSNQGAGLSFNNSWIDWVWELAALVIVLTGMAILLFSRPSGWGFGLGILTLSLAGLVTHLAAGGNNSDFSGYIRISQLAAYPLLPTLLYRMFPLAAALKTSQPAAAPLVERRRYSSDPRTIHAFLELKENDDPQNVTPAISKAIAHTMLADICYIARVIEPGQVTFLAGYDLVREEQLPGSVFSIQDVPLLAGALQRGKGLRITTEDPQPQDFQVIANELGLKEPGTLLLVPLGFGNQPWGGILLLSPYSTRQWTPEDQNFLAGESERIVNILAKAQQHALDQLATKSADSSSLQADLDHLQLENLKLGRTLEETRRSLEELRQKTQPANAMPEFEALVALQKESQDMITTLQVENERLKKVEKASVPAKISPEEFSRMEGDLRVTLQELAALQNDLAEANAKLLMREHSGVQTSQEPLQDQEVLISMVQDLRQPMVSIMGYTDILLSESVGILGNMQRKFLERIRASAERMRSMLNDLIQVAAPGSGAHDIMHRPVELGAIIDSAMLDTSAQLREKDITLRVDLPHEMPLIHNGRETVQQIIVHLLQNAGAATPNEGSITLRARVQEEQGGNFLLLQVSDTGDAIPAEQLQQVFNPHYRAEKALIQGLGDTGVGLSIAKNLVESQGGRIWVDSEAGQTTTFSVLLPLRSNSLEASAQ